MNDELVRLLVGGVLGVVLAAATTAASAHSWRRDPTAWDLGRRAQREAGGDW